MRAPLLSFVPSLLAAGDRLLGTNTRRAGVAVAFFLAACSKGRDRGVEPAFSVLPAPIAPASASGSQAVLEPAPATSASSGPGVDPASLFAGAPDDPAPKMRAIKHAGSYSGAVVAVAEGWAANDYEDDGDLLLVGASPGADRTGDYGGRLYVIAEKVAKPRTEPDNFTESDRASVAYIAGGRKVVWGAPWFGTRGAEGAKVKVWRGEAQGTGANEGKRGVYAFSTWAADKRVQGVGSWALARAQDEKAIIQMIKSLKG
jgi:hypothetical protein